ncbi:MAG: glycoside hydrolase family 15 protein [Planctomycetota bacterium]|nr:MAG: glycoside hydrolase family 15 protein [Planctomycetota bacterium]
MIYLRAVRLERIGLVGNCQSAALVDDEGAVAWLCFPRFDSEPVFARLLDDAAGGEFAIGPEDGGPGRQTYLENTNVLATEFDLGDSAFRVLDFLPRFELHGRAFHPSQLVRIIEPLRGTPRVRVRCAPVLGWSRRAPDQTHGSNHVRYLGYPSQLRLTTDVPLAYLDGLPFTLTRRTHLVLTWGAPVEEPLQPLCDQFLDATCRYWRTWVKESQIPALYQRQVIRSALALKLHCYEDTGAIVAATTTSIPEAPASGRTWDYRYCWLRDAFYSLGAFRLLGHFEEREKFVHFLLDVVGGRPSLELPPLYRVDGRSDLDEHTLDAWRGYEGERPVRIGNGAARHVQNDVYGEMVLALAPIYADERFSAERSPNVLALLERLARRGIDLAGAPDAGIWEVRTEWQPQSFTTLMSWAGADRMAGIATRHAPALETHFRAAAARLHAEICERAWNPRLGSFVGTYGGDDLDASLLQAVPLRFLPPADARMSSTIDALRRGLDLDGWMRRYAKDDGFGMPQVAFVLCKFWLIEALARSGRVEEARGLLDRVCGELPPLGLIAEDYAPSSKRMWGNFPQAYSHVGLIHAAFAASPGWSEVL